MMIEKKVAITFPPVTHLLLSSRPEHPASIESATRLPPYQKPNAYEKSAKPNTPPIVK